MRGRVKWWCPGEGYGFIECENESNIFVHIGMENIKDYHVSENQEIEFTIEEINYSAYIKSLKIIEQA